MFSGKCWIANWSFRKKVSLIESHKTGIEKLITLFSEVIESTYESVYTLESIIIIAQDKSDLHVIAKRYSGAALLTSKSPELVNQLRKSIPKWNKTREEHAERLKKKIFNLNWIFKRIPDQEDRIEPSKTWDYSMIRSLCREGFENTARSCELQLFTRVY